MKKQLLLLFGMMACWITGVSQQTYTFSTGGATGQYGPSQSDINTAYTGTNLAGAVTVNGGIQYWVVPQSGYYSIQALGAQGYGPFGGRGADITGEFILTAGDTIKILVGQEGAPPVGSGTNQHGGGGGSFVAYTDNTPLVVAGGGGGSWASAYNSTTDASITQNGNDGVNGLSATYNGAGGTNGNGGVSAQNAAGGGGFYTDGQSNSAVGLAFVNGGAGGRASSSGGEGGFGGGGGASSYDNRRSGGGGGYSGGGGAAYNTGTAGFPEGGGGGSFNAGANPTNVAGVNLGDGQVIITPLSFGAPYDIGVLSIDEPVNFCAGSRNVVTTIQNFGSQQITSVTLNWSINGVTQTPYSWTGSLDTIGGTGLVTAQVTLGSYNFLASTPYTISVWSSLPNGQADTVNANDTVTDIRQSGLVAPTGLAASNITGTTADISWNALGGLGWVLEYGPMGFTPGTGTTVTGTTAGYTITNMNPTTDYDVYLADSCGVNDVGAWAGPLTFATGCISTISGNYTIDQNAAPSATNFTSFTQLAFAMNTCGVSGPATVNVVAGSGPYYESVEFGAVTGMSSTNTVTINGNGESIIDSGSTSTNNAAVLLNGTNHLVIDSVNIERIGSTNSVGLQFMNSADSNIVRNCEIEVSALVTTSSVIPVTFSGSATSSTASGNNGNYNLLEGNQIIGGYYGIRNYGGSSTYMVGNQFVDNTVQDFYYYGIYNYYTEETKVIGNDIHRLNRTSVSNFYAIYNYYTIENVVITDNWIHDGFAQATGSTSTVYGIYSNVSDNSTGNEALVANNLLSNINNGGAHYMIYNAGSDGWNYYHNTIVENDPGAAGTGVTRLFYQTTTASDINFKNNLLYLDRGTSGAQYLMYLNATASGYDVDNNAYYMPAAGSTHDFGYYSGDQVDFTAWKAVNSSAFDQNSFEGDPFFADPSTGDFAPTAAYFNNIGTNLQSIVSADILGAPRSTTPDPGAYEFTPPPGPDMSVLNIYSGGASCGTSTDIIVEVINQGTDTVTSFTLNYTIGGVAQTPIAVTGVFATGDIDSISITGVPISSTAITTVVATITAVAPGTDTDPANNSGSIDLRSGLSGNYTVNQAAAASTTNFISFSSLADALMNYGICGNVVVDVAGTANTYTEQVWLDEIPGTSSSATVTINGNGNNLQFLSTSSGERATVTLNGTDWLTIDSLNITALGGSGDYGFGVILTNNADHNTFSNCIITAADDQTSSNFAGFAITGSLTSATTYGQSGNYNTIEGNTIHGGYYGITCQGESSDSTNGNIIRNNTIEDFYYYGAYVYYSRDLEFSGNDVSRAGRTTTTTLYAVRFYYNMSSKIVGNKIHDGFTGTPTSTSTSYYMYIITMDGTASNPTLIANNMVYNTESDGTTFGMYFSNFNNAIIAHNTVVLDDPSYSGTSTSTYCRGVYFTSSMADVDFSNNLIYYDVDAPSATNSYLVYANSSPSTMDNNAYYIGNNAPGSFGYSGGAISTFGDWQSSTNRDGNSVLTNPFLTDLVNGDFTPRSSVIDGLGVDLTSLVAEDINGATRSVPTDPGAIEFTGAPCTGFSGIIDTTTASSATVMWNGPGQSADILWGPVGFMQASITPNVVSVSALDTNGTIMGLNSNSCYEYYIQLNCTSSIPGAPPVMGPFIVCTDCANGPLNGTYTVGGTAGPNNFATLDSVIDALQGCGINGPVVFNLQGGNHSGFTLGQVDGSSATNTITFNGSPNYGDTIMAGSGAAIDLDGTSYVNFNDLYVSNTTGFVVYMHNAAHHLNFDGCDLVGDETTSSSSNSVFVASGSSTSATTLGDNASYVSLTNSMVRGGYYGVSFYGPSSSVKVVGLELSNNIFTDQYSTGARVYYTDSVLIEENSITGLRSTTSYGMYIYYTNNIAVLANEVYDASTYALYFYYSNYLYATPGSYSIVANNMLQSSGTAGLYAYYPVNVDFFHNSIQGGTTYGMYLSGSATATQDVDIRNNIIENAGTGTALNVGTAPANTDIDYNLYYSGGNIGNGHSDLAAWVAADTMWNQNSVEGTISSYTSSSDLHTIGTDANDVGDNAVGILVDIDGDVRPASGSTVVDMGADEYTPLSYDVASSMIVDPTSGGCGDSNTTVSVVFTNLGLLSATNVGVTVNISGPTTATMTGTYTGSLVSLESDTITVSSFNSVMGGAFDIEAIISYSNDQDASNDTVRTTVNISDALPRTPIAKFDSVCAGQYDTLYWPANSSNLLLQWETSTGDSLDINDTLVVGPMGPNDTTFVLSQRAFPSGNVGPVDNSIGSYGDVWNTSYGLYFDVFTSTVLTSVDVFPTGNGVIEFILEDANNNVIDTRLVQITGGSQTSPFRAVLNFNLAPGTGYILRPGANSTTHSIRNNTGGNYPYTLPGVLSITGNLFNSGPGPYYYYFYNWQVGGGCSRPDGSITLYNSAGALSAAFTETLQNPTDSNMVVDFDASASAGATSYTWDFGDGTTGSGITTSHTYDTNGTYNVVLTITGPCGTDTISKTISVNGISLEENALSRSMSIYPNPADDVVTIHFETLNQNAVIRITDMAGKEVLRLEEGNINKYFDKAIDISKLSKGVYMLEVSDRDLSAVRRLIKD